MGVVPSQPSDPTAASASEASPKRVRNARGNGSQLRTDLLNATTAVLAGLGNDEVLSLRAVARAAGVAPTAVYLHFQGRDDLISATVERQFQELSSFRDSAEDTAARAGGGPWERLQARTVAYVRWALQNPGAYRVLYGGKAIPRLSSRESLELGQRMLDRTDELVQELTDAQLARPTVSPSHAGLLIWATCHGIVSLRIDKDTIDWPDAETLALEALESTVRPV